MKKFFSIEFFWFIVALMIAIPMGYVILRVIGMTSHRAIATRTEQEFIVELYLVGVAVSFVGVYIARFVAAGIGALLGVDESAKKDA